MLRNLFLKVVYEDGVRGKKASEMCIIEHVVKLNFIYSVGKMAVQKH